jgi:F-type H+-transporting ATPase subunit b
MSRRLRILFAIGLVALLITGAVFAQESQGQRPEPRVQSSQQGMTPQPSVANANTGVAAILTKTTEDASHTAGAWGHRLGLGKDASYGISLAVNFGGIVAFIWLLVAKLPRIFRARTATIQKGIKEAQAASAEAQHRLSDIEARLSKLDAEVQEIRRIAEHEAAAEEERIGQAAEQDKERIVAGAQAEIQAIARSARRDLKGYAASLAVDLAARRIRVDEPTDQVLVRDFVDQLGKDGH